MDYYLSLVLGILLSISEILPYIKNIQGNGIINSLQTFIKTQSEIGSNLLERMESEQLLESQTQNINTLNNLSKINQNTFTLKSPDEYQLMYIENCIKTDFTKKIKFDDISDKNCNLLKSLGYKIEYNPNEDTYLIHW